MTTQYQITVDTPGRCMINITDTISKLVIESTVANGLCHIFLHHTSASLVLCENADPQVQRDAEAFMQRLAPDGDVLFKHKDEGEDDMPSHIRTMLTQSFLSIPITNKCLALGTWQGIYLWEHRLQVHPRRLTITIL